MARKKQPKKEKPKSKRQLQNEIYNVLRVPSHHDSPNETERLLARIDEARVNNFVAQLAKYIDTNFSETIKNRSGLVSYRTNPYVLLASANLMNLSASIRLADFIFNTKFYMGLETSFGKSVEKIFVGQYPIGQDNHWSDPLDKTAESEALKDLSDEKKARRRTNSVWREIDKSWIVGNKCYLVSIKSGPNTINDTQVEGMKEAIAKKHKTWLQQTQKRYPEVTHLDIVVGITYGTNSSTNNKENQLLVKLLEHGFVWKDSVNEPGVLVDQETRKIRVYRCVGRDFWSLIGNPENPKEADFVFLEVMLALTRALTTGALTNKMEELRKRKIDELAKALEGLTLPRKNLPQFVQAEVSEPALFWLATALTLFDDGPKSEVQPPETVSSEDHEAED
jgi:Type II restriction endonuclease EcoO109I